MADIAATVEVGAALWRASEDLKLRERLKDAFAKKETLIVLGASGVGKTNLIISLNAAAGLVDPVWRMNRTSATVRRHVRIDDHPFRVIDTPGQFLHDSERLSAVREAAANPPVRIINVVAYGYHEDDRNSNVITPGPRLAPDFLDGRREEELRALKEWLPILGDRSVTKWLVTVVAKADLWWHERESVLNHYNTGKYSLAIQEEDSKLHHVVIPYCSVVHRFYDRMPIDGTFDDSDRIKINLHFLQQLVDLR
jgi:hypothetical protein